MKKRIPTVEVVRQARARHGKRRLRRYAMELLKEYRQDGWGGEFLPAICFELAARHLASTDTP